MVACGEGDGTGHYLAWALHAGVIKSVAYHVCNVSIAATVYTGRLLLIPIYTFGIHSLPPEAACAHCNVQVSSSVTSSSCQIYCHTICQPGVCLSHQRVLQLVKLQDESRVSAYGSRPLHRSVLVNALFPHPTAFSGSSG